MIESIKYIEGWTLINNVVKVHINPSADNKIIAQFDPKLIKEMDALNLLEEFIISINKKLDEL